MKKLIHFFIENHKLTIVLSLMMIVFGFMGMKKLNSESYPSVNFAMAIVETRYDGATAKDVELKITKPIEDAIREVSGLKDIRSVSKSGLSSIFVRIDMDNEDEDLVMDELQKAVDGVTNLPADLREDPKYLEVNSEEFPALELAVVGDNTGRARDIMVDHFREELEDNKRVKNVRTSGWLKRQFNIRLDVEKMKAQHIGVEEVLNKIKMRNIDIPGGNLNDGGVRTLVRVEGKIADREDIANIVIRSNFSGQQILLSEIATVIDGEEDAKHLATYDGKPATFLIINKKAGADTMALVDDVNIILEKISKQYAGQFEIIVYNNEADKVKKKLEILSSNAISGLILVVVFLFLFLPGKIGLVASMSLPLAVMATFGFMPMMGMNLDAITILALVIALGMLVDNAVVISENFARIKEEEGLSSYDAATKSVNQLWLPITTTALTTIAAFLPMLVTSGIMGQFIKWIPIVVTIALLVSLGESFFLLPMRLRFAGGKQVNVHKKAEVKKDWFHKFIVKFEHFMAFNVKHRYMVFVVFILILVGSFSLMIFGNKFMLFPPDQTEIYLGRVEMPRGTTTKETLAEVKVLVNELKEELGTWQRAVIGRAGTSSMGPTDPKGATGQNHGFITVYASDLAKYNIDYKIFKAKMKKVTSDKAVKLTFQELVNGPPVGAPVNATFRSNNSKSLNELVEQVKKHMSGIKGISDVEIDDILAEKEVKVLIDYNKADQLGLTVSSIGNAIRTAMSGTVVSKVTLNNKEIDLNVRYKDNARVNLEDIGNVKVMDAQGNLVPVSTVAKTVVTGGSFEIKRFDYKRSKTLTANVDGIEMTSVIANAEVVKIFNKLSEKYIDVTITFGGEGKNTAESMQSLATAGMMAAMGIFGLLVFLFKSYLRPMIIMSTIPLGFVGFSVAFFFHNRPISFLALIGIIGLAGIIVNAGIVLISFIDQLRSEGRMDLDQILVKASGMRLRAVLVTSLTTVSGLMPTAYGIGGSDAMLVPMTMAMAWGLTSGTIFTLIWIPCAYAILEDWNEFLKKVPVFHRLATHDSSSVVIINAEAEEIIG